MRQLLLDTHVLLWSQLAPERLAAAVSLALDSSDDELWCSPLSVWEIGLLQAKGRIRLDRDLAGWIVALGRRRRLREAALSTAVVHTAHAMRFEHHDPVDRFLAATAKLHHLTLVTADRQLLARQDIATLAAA